MDYSAQSYIILETFSAINIAILLIVSFNLRKVQFKTITKGWIYFAFAFLTLLTHYVPVLIELFKGTPIPFNELADIYYLPIYPCNMLMWANLIFIPFVFNPGRVSKIIAPFLFIFGCFCGFFGLVLNFNFLEDPSWSNIVGIKSIVSHVFLLYTSVSLMVFGIVDFKMFNSLISCVIGLAYFILCFLFSRGILILQGKDVSDFDPLYLNGINENARWLNLYLFVPLVLIVLIVLTTLYETKSLPLEQRWYYKFSKKEKHND